MNLLRSIEQSVLNDLLTPKGVRGKYEAVLLYVTRPSGASLSKRNILKSARQGGVTRPLVPACKVNEADKENSDSREGSPGKPVQCSGRASKRGLALQSESNDIPARMERREKRPRAAVAVARSRLIM